MFKGTVQLSGGRSLSFGLRIYLNIPEIYEVFMRVKSSVDKWFIAIVFAVIAIMIAADVLLALTTRFTLFELVIGCAAALLVSAFLLWLLFGTYYEIRDDNLYCRSGPFTEKIKYDSIKYLGLSENFLSSMALSSQRIEIRQHGKSYIRGTTMISPAGREIFLAQLKSRCLHLDPGE